MTLEERVLEVLTERPLRGTQVIARLSTDSHAAVATAVCALVESGKLEFVSGVYRRTPDPAPARIAANDRPRRGDSQVTTRAEAVQRGAAPFATISVRAVAGAVLTKREREVYELSAAGVSNDEICERLGMTPNNVNVHFYYARKKLEIEALRASGKTPKSAPSAVGASAASPEDADTATVGAAQPSNELPKGEVRAPAKVVPLKSTRRITVSPGVKARLIEQQREQAEEVQMYCELLSRARQKLADIEEIVRVVSEEGR